MSPSSIPVTIAELRSECENLGVGADNVHIGEQYDSTTGGIKCYLYVRQITPRGDNFLTVEMTAESRVLCHEIWNPKLPNGTYISHFNPVDIDLIHRRPLTKEGLSPNLTLHLVPGTAVLLYPTHMSEPIPFSSFSEIISHAVLLSSF